MNFLSSDPSPIFLDEVKFKIRMDRLTKLQNYYLANITNEDSFKLVKWLSERKIWCERCNNQFYSNEGFVNHGCMR